MYIIGIHLDYIQGVGIAMQFTYRHFITPHKVVTPFFILSLMYIYDNTSVGSLVYLALHGTYCINWLLKEAIFPDKSWDRELPLWRFVLATLTMPNYWWAPWLLISRGTEPHKYTIFAAVVLNILGTFVNYCCDAQKYFVLAERPGLITNGFFAYSRNLNYLGEILLYLGFAILAEDPLPLGFLLGMVVLVFYPKMWEKDNSLSRHKDFQAYKENTWLMFPRLNFAGVQKPTNGKKIKNLQ